MNHKEYFDKKIETLTIDINTITQQITNNHVEVDMLQSKIDFLHENNTSLRREISNLVNLRNSYKEEIDKL